jgi:hypothetical protein
MGGFEKAALKANAVIPGRVDGRVTEMANIENIFPNFENIA